MGRPSTELTNAEPETRRYLNAAQSAVRDPEGARVAWLSYGELNDWPDVDTTNLHLRGGETGWRQTIAETAPLWLGIAWGCLEDQERRRQAETTNAKGQTNVPTLQPTKYTGVGAGPYSAIVTEITETEGEFGPQLQFQFGIIDWDGLVKKDDANQPLEIRGWCSRKWGPKTKLLTWARALLKQKCPAEDDAFDTDLLLKKRCDIVVEETTGKDGSPRTKLAGVYPFKTMTRPADDDEDDDPSGIVGIDRAK